MNSVTVTLSSSSGKHSIVVEAINSGHVYLQEDGVNDNTSICTDWTDLPDTLQEEIGLAVAGVHRAAEKLQELIRLTQYNSHEGQ